MESRYASTMVVISALHLQISPTFPPPPQTHFPLSQPKSPLPQQICIPFPFSSPSTEHSSTSPTNLFNLLPKPKTIPALKSVDIIGPSSGYEIEQNLNYATKVFSRFIFWIKLVNALPTGNI
ncbi:hypothetical protein Salat_1694200 [Sesamum alatum]|uniref:Uncharacterized protein n=1 Tax=Sesamum alatum TaxID=300844 RepID=A0AAE1Y795_9LAMI|nr:hypothetical protein Salat_1694200 [Sesamum alatum]